MADDRPPRPAYDGRNVNEDSLTIAFEDATRIQEFDLSSADAIDGKAVAVFSVSSALVGLAPALRDADAKTLLTLLEGIATLSWWEGIALGTWAIALVAWGVAAFSCYHAFAPRDFTVGPNPRTRLDSRWLERPPKEFKFHAIHDMSDAHDNNSAILKEKAAHLKRALFWTAVEALLLVVALLVF